MILTKSLIFKINEFFSISHFSLEKQKLRKFEFNRVNGFDCVIWKDYVLFQWMSATTAYSSTKGCGWREKVVLTKSLIFKVNEFFGISYFALEKQKIRKFGLSRLNGFYCIIWKKLHFPGGWVQQRLIARLQGLSIRKQR